MTGEKHSVPRVYTSINAITAELAAIGIAKTQRNTIEGYRFRGIDDVLSALAPLLAKHRLCILPRVLERSCEERRGANRSVLARVSLKVAFDIISVRDGSMHVIEVHSEALDPGDKATAKAMSAAYKQAVLQAFCIPAGEPDGDGESHRPEEASSEHADPVQGWEQWTRDAIELIEGCTTDEAVARVQTTYRRQLRTLSKCQSDLYLAVGRAISAQRTKLASPAEPEDAGSASIGSTRTGIVAARTSTAAPPLIAAATACMNSCNAEADYA